MEVGGLAGTTLGLAGGDDAGTDGASSAALSTASCIVS